jgi:hypothetical protein
MSTKREDILAASAAALAGTSGVGSRIYRSRQEALVRNEFPALIIEPLTDQPDRVSHGRYEWILTFHVTVMVRSDTPDQTADPIQKDVHNRLHGDTTLAGLVQDLVAGQVAWSFSQADLPQLSAHAAVSSAVPNGFDDLRENGKCHS